MTTNPSATASAQAEVDAQIERLDLSLFRHIGSQTTEADRKALLSLQQIARNHYQRYVYLEIGSHLGGSIQPHLIDSRCELIYSIDPRPRDPIPDERAGEVVQYPANSTQAMMDGLSRIPHGNLSKIVTFEKDASQLIASDTPRPTHLSFIDGEHTNKAVLSDFKACLPRAARNGIIAFHDCFLVSAGILGCSRLIAAAGLPFTPFHFTGSNVFAYALGTDAPLLHRF
ncbi:MAG TPA: class I SAM-dependent methyltransferase, partial [Vicinamibacterales bacterium]|nr:class I SAM-dependent methyltransferase [Vicinamibacterales bacterium]